MSEIVKEGKRLVFRQATEDDLDYIMEVEGRDENMCFIIPDTLSMHASTIKTPDTVHLIIEEKETGEAVGFLMICGLMSPHKEIEWRRIILDKKGEGYGQETLYLLAAWSFDDLGFHRAWLDCKDYNERALHVYEKAGLVREGLFRETILTGDTYENLIVLGILDREFFALREEKKIPVYDKE